MSPSCINPNKQWHPRSHTSAGKKKNNNMQPNTKFYEHDDTQAAKSSWQIESQSSLLVLFTDRKSDTSHKTHCTVKNAHVLVVHTQQKKNPTCRLVGPQLSVDSSFNIRSG